MSTLENKEFVRKYLEALSGKPKPASVVDQYVSEQALKDHVVGAEAGFPEYILEPVEMIAEGDKVSRCKSSALRAPTWVISTESPPLGRRWICSSISLATIPRWENHRSLDVDRRYGNDAAAWPDSAAGWLICQHLNSASSSRI